MQLLDLLTRAARGEFLLDDGEVELIGAPAGPCDAVIAFTAHSVIAADVKQEWVDRRLPRDDLTGPMRPDFLAALAGELGVKPGSLDVLLVAQGVEGAARSSLIETLNADAPTERARKYRSDVRTYASSDGTGLLNIGRGVAGRWDLSIELAVESRSCGRGRDILEASRQLIPADQFLFASVAPGNARCLRACLAAGFTPIGAEVLFLTRPSEASDLDRKAPPRPGGYLRPWLARLIGDHPSSHRSPGGRHAPQNRHLPFPRRPPARGQLPRPARAAARRSRLRRGRRQ